MAVRVFFRLRCTNTAFQPILICAPNCWIRPITGWIITHSQQVAEVVQHKMLVQAERPETARHFNQNLCNAMSASDWAVHHQECKHSMNASSKSIRLNSFDYFAVATIALPNHIISIALHWLAPKCWHFRFFDSNSWNRCSSSNQKWPKCSQVTSLNRQRFSSRRFPRFSPAKSQTRQEAK